MKAKSILFLLFICFSFSAFAQEEVVTTTYVTTPEKKPKFWIGPKFGLDVPSTTTDLASLQAQLKGNYQAGILMQFGRTLYIQPEVYYATRKENIAGTLKSVNSIKVPLMLGLRFLNLGLFSLHVTGGPQFSYKLDEKDRLTGDKAMTWQVGAGVDLLGFITTDLRYTMINGMPISDQITRFTTNPTTLNLTVGLKLR